MATTNKSPGAVPVTIKGKNRKPQTLSIPAVTVTNGGAYVGGDPPKREYPVPPNNINPISLDDIKLYALDLIAIGKTACQEKRSNALDKIWLIRNANYLGKQKPTWDDFILVLKADWPYRNMWQVDTISDPPQCWMHRFRRSPPTGLDAFVTAAGIEMDGYIKFYFNPDPADEKVVMESFHGEVKRVAR